MGIEVALQNTTLALLVAGTILQNNEMVKPALVYALFSFWTALLYGIIVKKYNKAKLFGEFN
jgi:BASS family bile acid:Na+ symporter